MPKNKYTNFIYFAIAYSFIISLLYIYSYWSSFEINILKYISIADILKSFIYVLIGFLIFVFIGAKWSEYRQRISFRQRTSGPTKVTRAKKAAVLFFILIMVEWVYHSFSVTWFFLSMVISIIIYRASIKFIPVAKIIPAPKLHKNIFFFLFIIPFLAFGCGKWYSSRILYGEMVRYVNVGIFKDPHLVDNQEQLKYLGFSGQHHFFLKEDNSKAYPIKSSEISTLEIDKQTYTQLPFLDYFKKEWKK